MRGPWEERTFQAEGTTSAETLGQELAWHQGQGGWSIEEEEQHEVARKVKADQVEKHCELE
jgi:hypothetical protein